MTEQQPTKAEARLDYVHLAVTQLSEAWIRPIPNRSGMRAVFRRWRPDTLQEPSHEMRNYVWAWLGAPGRGGGGEDTESISMRDLDTLEQAAVLVALRAVAGDNPKTQRSFGAALKAAKLSDLRLMRLLTTPRSMRLEALNRALRFLDNEEIGFPWTRREVGRMLGFLYGTQDMTKRSSKQWATDFFAFRGKTEDDTISATQPSTSLSQE